MPGPRLRTLVVLAVLGAMVARAVRLLRHRSAPDMSRHPVVDGGLPDSGPASELHSVTDLDPAAAVNVLGTAVASDAEPITIDEAAALVDVARHSGLVADPVATPLSAVDGETATVGAMPDDLDRQPAHGSQLVEGPEPSEPVTPVAGTPAVELTALAPAGREVSWVEPADGACPEGFPVKAKLRSGIYHLPATSAYDRTNPDRCYPSAEAAAADGLRAPKH